VTNYHPSRNIKESLHARLPFSENKNKHDQTGSTPANPTASLIQISYLPTSEKQPYPF
jgi:hypothetical protein